MPARVKKIKGKFRVVEPSGRVVKNRSGTAVDGGGSRTKTKALKQVQAINLSTRRKRS